MFSFFKKDPIKKLEKQYEELMREARDIQRSGDLRLYAEKMAAAEALQLKIEALRAKS
ncbi:DUF6435 family protein [Saprospira grandis]|uniref:Lacal_2735 family protein n=1 Tax=Saprospira grandis (strain Lewin) TaxID=984262 RepID=H6L1S7_SAPGL|nr:DUF6435 family protein [Saprospira grandis]AFC26155.1 hypothetical protein SGRA_3430 [Saprospira grandis str. Lewin]